MQSHLTLCCYPLPLSPTPPSATHLAKVVEASAPRAMAYSLMAWPVMASWRCRSASRRGDTGGWVGE